MRFSLIIGTVNRKDSLKSCLRSLLAQKYEDYEIIIIDQSDNDDTSKLIDSIEDGRIKYIRTTIKGLSKARNLALKYATGDYICLVDDDACYSIDYLINAYSFIKKHPSKVILSGRIFDTEKKRYFAKYKKTYNTRVLPRKRVLHTCPSAGLVIPGSVLLKCGGFDEEFGIGSKYGSGEETDLLIRAIRCGFQVVYLESLILKHPVPIVSYTEKKNEKKKASYSVGLGALYKKHFSDGEIYLKVDFIVVLIKLCFKRVGSIFFKNRFSKIELESFLYGFNSYEKKQD